MPLNLGVWKKSSRSNGNGGNNCVETLLFVKADKSGAAGACVEVAKVDEAACMGDCAYPGAKPGDVIVRDSKQNGTEKQPYIIFTEQEWKDYLQTLRMGYGAIFDGEDTFVIFKNETLLKYTWAEWDAFMDGVNKNEFDYPGHLHTDA